MRIDEVIHNKTINLYSSSIVFKLICVIIGFANSVLINRTLGVALRGNYTTITNVANMCQLVLNLGIGTAYPSYKRKDTENGKTVFTTLLVVTAAIYGAMMIPLVALAEVQNRYILILSFLMTIENIVTFMAIVEGIKQKNKINIVISAICCFLLVISFSCFKYQLYMVLNMLILNHILIILAYIIRFGIYKIDFRLLSRDVVLQIGKTAIPAMLMNLLMYANYHADVVFLSYLIDDSVSVGLYGTAVTLGNMLWIVPDAFKDVIFNRSAKKDNPQEIIVAIGCNAVICVVILIGFVILGEQFLRAVYGVDFVDAYPIVLLLFVGTLPMILYKLIHPLYIANGKTKVVVKLLTIAVVINFVGNILLIPKYKAIGAAIASVASYSICGIAFLIKFWRDYDGIIKMQLVKKRGTNR